MNPNTLPTNTCTLCGNQFKGYGNNTQPLIEGICCNKCNNEKVIPARLCFINHLTQPEAQPEQSKNSLKEPQNRGFLTKDDNYTTHPKKMHQNASKCKFNISRRDITGLSWAYLGSIGFTLLFFLSPAKFWNKMADIFIVAGFAFFAFIITYAILAQRGIIKLK